MDDKLKFIPPCEVLDVEEYARKERDMLKRDIRKAEGLL